MKPDAVLIFAAGFGTRMGALTADRPKPLVEVAGTPLIDHALRTARDAGIRRIVANAHYRADMLAAHLAPQDVALSHETPEILETGGGLRAALPLLGPGPVLTLNSDAIWQGPNPLSLLRAAWEPDRMDALLVCVAPGDAAGHAGEGDFRIAPDNRLTRAPGLIYGGAQVIRPDLLADIPDRAFSLNPVWDRMQAAGRLFGIRYPGRWCDVGHPAGIGLAEDLLADV